MASVLECLLLVLLVPMAAVSGLFLVQALAATAGARHGATPPGQRPSVAILVPAHDESAGIAETLRSIQPQLAPGDRLVVVADNCTDSTAAVACDCGAEVFVRNNAQQVGKGYALDAGLRFLGTSAPQVVIVVDADCEVAAGAIDLLARRAHATGRPIQALYLMRAPPGTGLTARIAAFAWIVRNCVRPLGLARLGQPCQLMGAGMAFPWVLISTAPLANGNLVEDITLGLELAGRGTAPQFCPEALVTSYFPKSRDGLRSQRYRWEHGHLGAMLGQVPRSLLRAVRTRNLPLAVLACDLLVPPLALLLLAIGAMFVVALGLTLSDGPLLPLLETTALLATLSIAMLVSWWRFGRDSVSLWDLCLGPGYILWKLPVYLHFFVRRQVRWIRSERS